MKNLIFIVAYNHENFISSVLERLPEEIKNSDFHILVIDDASEDNTFNTAINWANKNKNIGITVLKNIKNLGYGGNQKSCYNKALELNADIVIMLHPDYQYTPKLIRAMSSVISEGNYKVVFGSRILGKGALKGGMPIYKYIANRILTLFQNILINQKLKKNWKI